MKKRIGSLVWMLAAVAFAGWPYGNIGLNADNPEGQLDVGGRTVIRGACIIKLADDERTTQENIDEAGNVSYGFLWWCPAMGDFVGIEPDMDNDGELLLRGDLNVRAGRFSTKYYAFGETGYVGVGHDSYSNCSGTNVVVHPSLYDANEFHFFLSDAESDYFGGATLVFEKPDNSLPVHVSIWTYSHDSITATLAVNLKASNHSGKPWFTVDTENEMLVELLWTPARGGDETGRWTFVRAIDTATNAELEPTFLHTDGGRVLDDGSEF